MNWDYSSGPVKTMNNYPTFCLIAGEPSGDRLGAALMQGLQKELDGKVNFIGVGGPNMAEMGLDSLFPMEELSIMGLVEVLPKLFSLLKRVQQTADYAVQNTPIALITIDSPDFCLRVAKMVKILSDDIPVIHYVAPSVWAWRPKRADKMARYVDHVLALLPFEPPYMEAAGMSCDFVGHPVVAERQATTGEITQFREAHNVRDGQILVTVLPGSRKGEVARLGPIFKDVIGLLRTDIPDITVIIPAVRTRVQDLLELFVSEKVIILDPDGISAEDNEHRKRVCFAASEGALAASGTVSLELAAAGTPMIIAYKMNPVTTVLIKWLTLISTATLVNLVSKKQAVPEYLAADCTAEKIYPAFKNLLTKDGSADMQINAANETMDLLGRGQEAPGLRAARSVLAYIQK